MKYLYLINKIIQNIEILPFPFLHINDFKRIDMDFMVLDEIKLPCKNMGLL